MVNKSDKFIILYFLSVAIIALTIIIYMNYQIGNQIFPEEITIKTTTTKVIDVDKEKIFEVISDIENYQTVLPKNVISVEIINSTDNVIYVNEELVEKGIKVNLLVQHIIEPYEKHTIKILRGDAKNTILTQYYERIDGGTKITTDIEIHLRGVLIPFGFTAEYNITHAIDTAISEFVKFVKNQ
jgi:carbon monoxide dehydrogenase subunit G